jgi:hypothetical protein
MGLVIQWGGTRVMRLSFGDKEVLRNIVLSNREMSACDLITNLCRIFDLTDTQKDYIKQVKRLNN